VLPFLVPTENQHGVDIRAKLPEAAGLPGVFGFEDSHARVWELAAPYLTVRDNDGHTAYAYGIARALVDLHPDADPEVVLPGIILHDTGWSQVPPEEVLSGIAPGGNRPDLVILHEKEGARIAREILARVGHDVGRAEEIVEIIDGHDSRLESLSLNDALLKDADKLWRLTPHGVDTVMNWFGLDRHEALVLIASRVHGHLFTEAARTMSGVLSAIASIDVTPQRVALG
jgi:hypothetical protein